MRALTLPLLLSLFACGPKEAPRGAPTPGPVDAAPPAVATTDEPPATTTKCSRNGDCVLTTFSGCCTCCPSVPRAFFKPDLAKAEAKCDTVRCPACEAACGPPVDMASYEAQCIDARCVAVPR